MKMAMRVVVCSLALASLCEAASVTPVQKVLTMMNEMKTKGEKMMAEEAKTYATYKEWVSDQSRELGFEIKAGKSSIEKLLAAIAKADSDVKELGAAITKLEGDQGDTEGELSAATDMRADQHAEYVKLSTDYSESVDALERAIQTMESKNYDVPEAASLLQRMAASKPGMRRVLAAFIQSTQKQEAARGGPAVAAYEFQSQGIVDLLESFLTKFKKELDEVEMEESNQAQNFNLEKINLDNKIDYIKKEIFEKQTLKAKRATESARAKSDLASTKKVLADDEKTLSDMTATYAAKSDQFTANQKVRKDELEAIAKAIEIMSDPAAAGSYENHINLAQVPPTLLQTRSARSRANSRQLVASFLQKKALALQSATLSQLAKQAAANPFDKVIDLIKNLVAKLKEEAAKEAEHKKWCDEQLHKNKLKREKKTAKVNKLTATIEALAEDIASMGKQIATLKTEQSDLVMAMSEATTQRDAEKATNLDTIADAKAGHEATKSAIAVLKEFYATQSFLQMRGRQVPEMAAYKGMSSAKGGVVGMLEVIDSDFVRLEADTTAEEEAAATEYAQFMDDSTKSKKAKHELEVKTSLEMDKTEFQKEQTTKDLESTQVELDKALEYQGYLKPVCLEVHVSFEERAAKRQEEIAALKEAYGILDKK